MASGSKMAVGAAIVGNTFVMIAKFVAFFITGSGAMLSEAIHTVADLFNQILLMIGIVRSGRAPDQQYHYGYGRERFVWALISAVGIFFLGCGVTIYHGIQGLMHPHELGELGWAIGVLIVSFIIEGIVFWMALRGLQKEAAGAPLMPYLRKRADPSAVAVLLEDGAACLGIIIALVGITLAKLTGDSMWDAISSLLIGALLGFVAVWLVGRNRVLLIGQAIEEEATEKMRELLVRDSIITRVAALKTRVIDTETYDIMAEVNIDGAAIARHLDDALSEAYAALGSEEAFKVWAAGFADEIVRILGQRIDALEAQLREAFPEAKHIDIEPD